MDSQIYMLLARADQEKNVDFVRQAFSNLDPDLAQSSNSKSANDVDNFSQNLYVECAEKALNFQELTIANRCIQIYFSLPMIANQFLARAYLCQFELLAPRRTYQLENLEKSVPFLFKAIEFSLQNKRYNFLVYNASIIFWKYARMFLKDNFRRYLCPSLKMIAGALKKIDDPDNEWRAFLDKILVEAYLDNKQINEACSLANELSKFIQTHLPNMFDEYFEFMINKNLIDEEEIKVISSSKWELNAIYRIEKLKKVPKPKKSPFKTEENSNQQGLNEEQILNELSEIYKIILPQSKFSPIDQFEDSDYYYRQNVDSLGKKEDQLILFKRQKLLLNLAHTCLIFGEVNLCSQILGYLKEAEIINEEFSLELEFIECEQTIKELRHKQEKYTKNIVKVRSECVNKLHELLKNAQRLNNPRLIQLGCRIQWNICLPLLQPGIRKYARKALHLVAECLESIDSMEWLFRCQVHFEIAKCDEEIEQLQTAEHHFQKALQFDDQGIYREHLNHSLKRLQLKAELYKTPERTEDQVAMILEQCVVGGKTENEKKLKPAVSELLRTLSAKTKSDANFNGVGGGGGGGGEINTHSLLLRAADLLAPNEFTHVLESETFKSNFGKINEDQVSKLSKKSLNYENCIKKCADHVTDRISDLEREFHRNNEKSQSNKLKESELEKLLAEDYKERLKLWLDLSRIARKQQIWDICRVSARFCLLYDNESLIKRFLKTKSSQFGSLFDKELMRNLAEAHFILGESLIQYIRGEGIDLFEKPKVPESDEDIHSPFIRAMNKKTNENDPNNQNQIQKQDLSKKRNYATDKEWLDYCEWLNKMSKEAMQNFIRGIQIGVELNESWLVCQGSTYAWNYMHHIFEQKKHNQVVQILNEIFEALKKIGHNGEPELLVSVGVALSYGLMKQWLPPDHVKPLQIPNQPDNSGLSQHDSNQFKQVRKTLAPTSQNSSTTTKQLTIPSEANSDLKKALEICEYAMTVTNGENLSDLVSLKDRYPLIKTWVLAKQLNQSQIKSSFFSKNNNSHEKIQDKFTKCMIAVEMLNRNLKMNGQSSYEFKEVPSIKEIAVLIEFATSWPDKLVELELWSNLCFLAGKFGQTENLRYVHSKALESISYFEKKKNENKSIYLASQYLLSEACIALGEHLASIINSATNNSNPLSASSKTQKEIISTSASMTSMNKDVRVALRRDALNAFADAAGHAGRAENYELTIHAARHYWNLCLPYLQENQERATLFENLKEILLSLQSVYKFKPQQESSNEQAVNENEANKTDDKKEAEASTSKSIKKPTGDVSKLRASATSVTSESKKKKDTETSKRSGSKSPTKTEQIEELSNDLQPTVNATTSAEKTFNPLEDAFDDLTLRCVLYACLFQILLDRQDYAEALEEMEIALNDLPRTKHRLLIYRFKVITKSKLGLDVQMDLQKFREESEKNLAQMYRKVALSSIKHSDTIGSYQRAIEALNSGESVWIKIEYILELAQWLYSHEYDLNDCVDLCEWAIDLPMFSIKIEKSLRGVSASTGGVGGRQSKLQSKKHGNKQTHNILPTIKDEEDTHNQIIKNTETEFDNLIKLANKGNLFEISISNKNVQLNDLVHIKQLECLIRSNAILAQMVGASSYDYNGYLLKAYFSLIRMFYQSVENAMHSIKEIQKLAALSEVSQNADKKKVQIETSKKGTVADAKPLSQKKLKLEGGANGYMPQSIEQWSQFELHEEITNAWSHDLMKNTGINQNTIIEPKLLFYYLNLLAKMLDEQGYTHLLFPIYNFQLILINCVLKHDMTYSNQVYQISMSAYIRLKLINLCIQLNLIQSVAFHQQSLATLILASNASQQQQGGQQANNAQTADQTQSDLAAIAANPSLLLKLVQIDPIEVCLIREQIHTQKQRLSQLEEEAFNATSTTSFAFGGIKATNTHSTSKNNKKKSQLKLTTINLTDNKKSKEYSTVSLDDLKLPGEHRKIHNTIYETLFKDIWILMAELLIQNGFFQTARDYLFESLNACNGFEDKYTFAKVQYLLGEIALFDCNFIEARNFASNAQKIAIDEIFWFKCIKLLVESHKQDRQENESYEKCIQILNKALDLVELEKTRRPNKKDKFEYIEAMLNYELSQITSDGLINGRINTGDLPRIQKLGKRPTKRNSMQTNLFKKLFNICNTFETSADKLISNGYKREAIKVLKSHAKLLKQFANDCHNLQAKHDYFLQTFEVLNDACNLANEIWIEIESLQQMNDLLNVSLPVQRELVELKLEFSQLISDMLECNLNEITHTNNENLKKDNISKTYENYINTTDNLNERELEWRSKLFKLPDLTFGNLISCFNLSSKIKSLRAQSLYLIGRTFRLVGDIKLQLGKLNPSETNNVSSESSPLSSTLSISLEISKWSPVILELIKTQSLADIESVNVNKSKQKSLKQTTILQSAVLDPTNETNESQTNQLNDDAANNNLDNLTLYNENSNLSYLFEQENLKDLLMSVSQSESQAIECLLQSLSLSFMIDDKTLTRNVSYELVELIGRFDLQLTSQLVALYQSCSNSIEIESLIEKSSLDPKKSLLVSYFNQFKFYKELSITHNSFNSPIVKQLFEATKLKFNAFKYLNINANHFNISKELPPNYLIFIIQHNQSRTELYATILDRSTKQGQSSIGKASKIQNTSATSIANSIKISTDPFELYHLQHLWKEWKANLQSFNLKIEFQLNNDLIKKNEDGVINNKEFDERVDDLMKFYLNPNNPKFDETIEILKELEEKFEYLMNQIETYLQPVTSFFQNYFAGLINEQNQQMANVKQSINLSTVFKPNEKVVILADLDLLEFPLESLCLFYNNSLICSICRDFSLQFFATRYLLQKESAETTQTDKKDTKQSKATQDKKPPAQAAQNNLAPLPEHAIVIDPTRFRYLIDTYNETSNGLPAEYSPINLFKKLAHQYPQLSSKWMGITGADHTASLGERERLLIESNCFLFYGTERYLSYFDSSKISSFNLNECKLVISNDLSQTSKSFSRLGKLDVLRNPGELECENPLESSILLSLAGVKSIMSNQWSCTLVENSEKLNDMFKEFVEQRQSCGEIIRYRLSPHIKQSLLENLKKEEEKKQTMQEKEKEKKDKKDTVKKDKSKSPTRNKSPKSQDKISMATGSAINSRIAEESSKPGSKIVSEEKSNRLRKENANMILYGLPDVFFSN